MSVSSTTLQAFMASGHSSGSLQSRQSSRVFSQDMEQQGLTFDGIAVHMHPQPVVQFSSRPPILGGTRRHLACEYDIRQGERWR